MKPRSFYYTGVGSRETPLSILYLMSQVSQILEAKGYVLRSGCAVGADAGFEDSLLHPEKAEIYVPNKAFPKKMGTSLQPYYIIPKEVHGEGFNGLYREATRLIHEHEIHRGWRNLKSWVMDLHNRNVFQVLGQDLKTPSDFTFCYTKDGVKKYEDTTRYTGGTGTAINASSIFSVPVYNMGNKEDFSKIHKFIEENKNLINKEKLLSVKPRSDFNKNKQTYEEFLPIIEEELKNMFDSKKKETNSISRKSKRRP